MKPRTTIIGLKSASLGPHPHFIPKLTGLKGARAKGMAYERRIARNLKAEYEARADVNYGQWIYFEDRRGRGVAQPDVLIIPKDPGLPIVVCECKLTYRPKAKEKLRRVYTRLVKHIHPTRKVLCVQICKNLTPEVDLLASNFISLDALLTNAHKDKAYVICHAL